MTRSRRTSKDREAPLVPDLYDLWRYVCGACGDASSLPSVRVTYLVREGAWRLDAPFRWEEGGTLLTVPAGWRFDLASVPRIFWTLIAPFELSLAAPLVHDFLYRTAGVPPPGTVEPHRTFTRAEADRIFCAIMARQGVAGWRLAAAYVAVRVAGVLAWRRGERRLERARRGVAAVRGRPG